MRILGLLAGVGSMLDAAREQGWDVLGNIETRRYFYTRPWWAWNFEEAPLYRNPNDAVSNATLYNADLAIGHPPCGAHSALGRSGTSKDLSVAERNAYHARRASRVGLLPLFTQLVRTYRPRAFALDNLPRILETVAPLAWWQKELPAYKLSTAVITNYDYGNVQRRKRLWVFGVRGGPTFQLAPIAERPRTGTTVLQKLAGLPWEPWENDSPFGHAHIAPGDYPFGGYHSGATFAERHHVKYQLENALGYLSLPMTHAWPYPNARTGRLTHKIGCLRLNAQGQSRVLSGMPSIFHPLTGWPLTPRERARLMGWPDHFILNSGDYPITRDNFRPYIMITGRGVPTEFVAYLLPQLRHHLQRG